MGTVARVHLTVSMCTSALGHAAVLAALAWIAPRAPLQWVSVEAGRASIDLVASMAATARRGELDGQPEPLELQPPELNPQEMQPPVLLALADVDVTPVTRDAARPSVPPTMPPSLAAAMPVPDVVPAPEQRVLHSQGAPSPRPDPVVQSMPHTPRADLGKRRAEDLVASTAESVPSPASSASRGARSDLPAIVFNPAPAYPADALAAGLEGRVLLRVTVSADGTVLAAQIHRSSGVESLDASALSAVRQWRFSTGEATREIIVPVRFRIEQ